MTCNAEGVPGSAASIHNWSGKLAIIWVKLHEIAWSRKLTSVMELTNLSQPRVLVFRRELVLMLAENGHDLFFFYLFPLSLCHVKKMREKECVCVCFIGKG